jgi:ParB-like chromosome segregation protein Spo0J
LTRAFPCPATETETRLRLEYLKPGEIRVKGRIREKDRGLQKLADSMEEYSLLQPVRVRQETGGGYTLVSGYRRLCAARRLAEEKGGRWETLPCIVVAGEDPVIAQAVENFQRQEMSSYELYKLLILLRDKNRSYGETAALIGCGSARVENLYVTVRELEGDEELEEVFRHAGVTFEDVAITRGIDRERRFALLAQRGNRELTREQLRREAGKLKKGSAAKHSRGTHGQVNAVWRESAEESLDAGRIVITVDNYAVFRELARTLWKNAERAAGKIQITINKEQ